MTPPDRPDSAVHSLEEQLFAHSTWDTPQPDPPAWRNAIRTHRQRTIAARLGIVASAATVLLSVGIVSLPALGTARSTPPAGSVAIEQSAPSLDARRRSIGESDGDFASRTLAGRGSARQMPAEALDEETALERQQRGSASPTTTPPPTPRAIIYTDTIRITVDDIAQSFFQAQQLVEPSLGEFVESSNFGTSDRSAVAEITLRIRSNRRGDVLIAVRSLGEVTSERSNASDVSDQLVDLEARIRNEQRIERELLELLTSSDDAPLEDILKVRGELAKVRGQIERMDAQIASIGDRVALAQLRLTLVQPAEEEPEPDSESSIWEQFTTDLASAWTEGITSVLASITWLVRVLLSGAIVWIALLLISIPIIRWIRS